MIPMEYDEKETMRWKERDAKAEGRAETLLLTSLMVQDGEADKIPLLLSDEKFREEMLRKYGILINNL